MSHSYTFIEVSILYSFYNISPLGHSPEELDPFIVMAKLHAVKTFNTES